ncbi:preprotein translocase subunit SecB [Lacticaseibacillus rhamnosus]|uniref:protein-export chaperone SecB n=1 Tax=Lacticaseibacillus rhamnosus TaxID=47715 RepID=UPI0021A7EDFE|nr:protein-export chaperone SecB [Lacticaseibacillus rhamnosus]MCT3191568.1 preprotein translocase subunit SecB [Lacticaseibacillus rhamnosus]MCT3372455.1 preprotein translocase subunit SecB [Lacticaseibacillus rhamnosus]
MAVLTFKTYHVDEMRYRKLKDPKKNRKFSIRPEVHISQRILEDADETQKSGSNRVPAEVTVSIAISEESLPFEAFATVTGSFVYEADEDISETGIDHLLKVNATAILFPYIRAIISSLTGMSNEFNQLILPTINLEKLYEEQNKES